MAWKARLEEVASSIVIGVIMASLSGAVYLIRRVFTDAKRIELLEQSQRTRDKRIDDLHTDVREMRRDIHGLAVQPPPGSKADD